MEEIKPKKSAITLAYYMLQSKLIENFQKVIDDPKCATHMELHGVKIKTAFGNALSWFYFVKNIAYNEMPLPIQFTKREPAHLEIQKGNDTLMQAGCTVLQGITPPRKTQTFATLVSALDKINALALQRLPHIQLLSRPTGESVDIAEHLEAQRDRLKVAIQMLERDLERLPSFQCAAKWKIPWKVENGKIVTALKKALERLEGLIKQDPSAKEQLLCFSLTVSTETWNVVIDSSRSLTDSVEVTAKEIQNENRKKILKRLATLHHQIASSTVYDLSHTITYLLSLAVTQGRTTHEVQKICQPLQHELKQLHYLNWEDQPETEEFICAVDKGYLELVSSLTVLDIDRVTPLELSAPARLVFLLDEAITDATDRAEQLKEVLKKTVKVFLEKPKGGTILRPTPKWRLRGNLISENQNALTKLLSSAVTPHYYQLHDNFLRAYNDLCQDPQAVGLCKAHFKEIQMAFPALLAFFYYVREAAYYQAPGSAKLDPEKQADLSLPKMAKPSFPVAMKCLADVENKWKGELPASFNRFCKIANQVARLALAETEDQKVIGRPSGKSTNARQHVALLSNRLGTTLEILKNRIEKLPCFISRLRWLAPEKLQAFDLLWEKESGAIIGLVKEMSEGLDTALNIEGSYFMTALLASANEAVWRNMPSIKNALRNVSARIAKAVAEAKADKKRCDYAQKANDLMLVYGHLVNTLVHDLEHHIAYLVPLLMTEGWDSDAVKKCARPTVEALETFCNVEWKLKKEDTSPMANEVRRAIRVIKGARAEMERLLNKIENGDTSPLTLSGPLRLAMAVNNAVVGISAQAIRIGSCTQLFARLRLELLRLESSFEKAMATYSSESKSKIEK